MRSMLIGVTMLCGIASAQDIASKATTAFPLQHDGLVIRRHVEAGKPFTVAGARGVILGQQEGTFESWLLPIKLLSNFRIRAEVEGYSVPIDVNGDAGEIDVHPDHTTITYTHIAFTLRQIMFAPDDSADGTGAVVLFQLDSTRPIDLTFSFTPEMRPMWPERGYGTPSPEWLKQADSGLYILHTDFPEIAGAVTIPGAQPGIMAPYQERPQVHPLELKLHYDPKRDGNRFFPLLMAASTKAETSTSTALQASLDRLNASLPTLYAAHATRYTHLAEDLTSITTPDTRLNDDIRWAEVSIEQLKARATPSGEIGLVAGYYSSGDSARPGFGWFFGRDSLYTLYAINSFGDFTLSRQELEFLMARQRDDGKMMHEYSQTAPYVDWKSFPYQYAAADATPLFLTAMLDYVRTSGDIDFLRQHREQVEKAWHFETTHDADGDGIYDNAQGTGWVESWPGGMPHQEVYLALLDQQASTAMSLLAAQLGDNATSQAAATRAKALSAKIESEYYQTSTQTYAFSRNPDGSLDRTATIYPAIAWWNGDATLAHPEPSLTQWASHAISTDWGTRDVAETEPIYDPISYHQGSVWPLFTGWASLAEYRAGRPLSAYAHLMQNANLTDAQDLGAVTELLSGAYFTPFGRSTSHQLWSSAMVLIPTLRGLFGITPDGSTSTLSIAPHLPADWPSASVDRLHIGTSICSLTYTRQPGAMHVTLHQISGPPLRLVSSVPGAKTSADHNTLTLPLPPVEVTIPHELPMPGARTAQMKVLDERIEPHQLILTLEAQAGSTLPLQLRRNQPHLKLTAEGADLTASSTSSMDTLTVHFPAGTGYQQQKITLHW